MNMSIIRTTSLNISVEQTQGQLLPIRLQGAGLGGRLNAAIVILTQAARIARLKQTLALLDAVHGRELTQVRVGLAVEGGWK